MPVLAARVVRVQVALPALHVIEGKSAAVGEADVVVGAAVLQTGFVVFVPAGTATVSAGSAERPSEPVLCLVRVHPAALVRPEAVHSSAERAAHSTARAGCTARYSPPWEHFRAPLPLSRDAPAPLLADSAPLAGGGFVTAVTAARRPPARINYRTLRATF